MMVIQHYWRRYAKVLFAVLVMVFLFTLFKASWRMVTISLATQPGCVVHGKPGSTESANTTAAKSSC